MGRGQGGGGVGTRTHGRARPAHVGSGSHRPLSTQGSWARPDRTGLGWTGLTYTKDKFQKTMRVVKTGLR